MSVVFLAQCKFNVSPYAVDVPKLLLNSRNLASIQNNEQNDSDDFKIALTADIHNYYQELSDLVERINGDSYRFTIVAGDITNLGLKEEVETTNSFLYRLKSPFLVAIGNHDLLANGRIIYSRVYGSENFSFEYKDVLFVFVNNNNWETSGKAPDLKWIKNVLSNSGATRKILVMHVPPDDPARYKEEEINEWAVMIDREQVDYVINGHNHSPVDHPCGNAHCITVGAPSKRFFYELEVTTSGVKHRKIRF